MSRPDVVITIPCYNEEDRLSIIGLMTLLENPRVGLMMVNDGSTDRTADRLIALQASKPTRVEVLDVRENRGKAEAVRAGLNRSIASGARVVGYTDADLSTPAAEMLRLLDVLESSGANAVLGARVAVLGAQIDRKHSRHYLGRVFATFASMVLRAPVYDTQCGAKLMRVTPALAEALVDPFRSRWAFDVELLGRLMIAAGGYDHARIIEEPLRRWADVGDSKLRPSSMVRAGLDLAGIAADLRRRRRSG